MTPAAYTYLAYAVVTVLLWGYAARLWAQSRALKRRAEQEPDTY